ncbi:MAG: EAL domain-containing response regulator [Gemmatimonadetes bacterium]|nr:EAL domain-containing response regulator [Gemmatimonadota bacterium]
MSRAAERGRPVSSRTSGGDAEGEIKHLTVLILEDHPFQRRMLGRLLLGLGHVAVVEASTGDEALEAVRRATPDLVIADLETPGMDGVTFLRMLSQDAVTPRVVLTSAHDPSVLRSVDEMAKMYGLQVLGAIPKPVSLEALRGFLNEVRTHEAAKARSGGRAHLPADSYSPEQIGEAISRGEIIPWFQPKVEVATGRLAGVEALARWMHPTRGMIGPGAFIPVIETTPLMDALSQSMLTQALTWVRKWEKVGLSITVSVNLPGGALADPSLADRLTKLVRSIGVEPAALVVEVTETTVSRERALAIETLARLRMAGFGLSLDDYGTGYASMEMLKTMPVTEVKVDRRFVHGASKDPKATAVLGSLLELASGLSLEAVAEGVETQEDLVLLEALECPYAQGYVIAKPMSGDDLLIWAQLRGPAEG